MLGSKIKMRNEIDYYDWQTGLNVEKFNFVVTKKIYLFVGSVKEEIQPSLTSIESCWFPKLKF